MMKNKGQSIIWIFAELILVSVGVYGLKIDTVGSKFANLFYIIVGLGVVALGMSVSILIKEWAIKGDERLERSMARNNDERNQLIASMVGARAFKLSNALILASILAFTFMNIDKTVLLVLCAVLLVSNIYGVVVSSKLRNKM